MNRSGESKGSSEAGETLWAGRKASEKGAESDQGGASVK